jgi:hypothetical protein
MEMKKRIPPEELGHAPEQRVIDPLTGRDVTGEYASNQKEEFEACLRRIFLDIAGTVMEEALKCHRAYFQSMKGATSIHKEDIETAVREEEERQKGFYDALKRFSEEFEKSGVRFEVMPPGKVYRDSGWDAGLVHGCNVRTDGGYLCAFPLVPATTSCYMALVQEPVAAQVVFASRDCVVLAPHGQDYGEAFTQAARQVFGTPRDIKDFPKARRALIGNSFLSIDSSETFSSFRLKETKERCEQCE